jgi:anionic cell wall polymer biosynthesis LytR-Cps2A-Psr (LCP) family protein
VQTLDGAQSLAFVRQRHGLTNGDLDRTHRQQAFLASAVNKLQHAGVFDDLTKVGALLDVARKDVVVDSGFDLLSFISQAGAVTSGNVTFYTLPIKGFATEDGESVNLIDPFQVREVAQRLLAGQSPEVSDSGTPTAAAGPAIPQAAAEAAAAPATHRAVHGAASGNRSGGHTALSSAVATPATAAVSAPPGIPCVN